MNKLCSFIDKDKGGNLNDGLEYYAAELVEKFYLDNNGNGKPSGKDYAVEYINPGVNIVVNGEVKKR